MKLEQKLAELMGHIVTNFTSFNAALASLYSETERGNNLITKNIEETREEAKKGLTKVSSGIAHVEVLQSKFESHEVDFAIERSVDEISNQYKKAHREVEAIQKTYDEHFKKIERGLQEQLKVIASHIFKLREENFSSIEKLQPDMDDDANAVDMTIKIQDLRSKDRSSLLEDEFSRLDLDQLNQFQVLREKLEAFISGESAVRMENFNPDELLEVDTYCLPVNYVCAVDGKEVEFYCLNADVKDCYTDPRVDADFDPLLNTIRSLQDRIDMENCSRMEDDELEGIRQGLASLREKDMLREDHYQLILEHLKTHPLMMVEM